MAVIQQAVKQQFRQTHPDVTIVLEMMPNKAELKRLISGGDGKMLAGPLIRLNCPFVL
ncbi:hypothetical protein [Paenibacillus agricola]|uniref:hypothetical protein n=1 Tax=Paenibacillus agricola TaxID=2716264 RepID=UPI001A9F6DF4|nr:hypothetical protein [Paenibacillus agricola]